MLATAPEVSPGSAFGATRASATAVSIAVASAVSLAFAAGVSFAVALAFPAGVSVAVAPKVTPGIIVRASTASAATARAATIRNVFILGLLDGLWSAAHSSPLLLSPRNLNRTVFRLMHRRLGRSLILILTLESAFLIQPLQAASLTRLGCDSIPERARSVKRTGREDLFESHRRKSVEVSSPA